MFLKPESKVVATDHRDYPEWHHGRQQFALWYIEITDPALLQYLHHLRQLFSEMLYQPNTRQFHITVFICGFLTQDTAHFNDDFTHAQFTQQCAEIQRISSLKCQLKTAKINSFESALFVEVDDTTGILKQYRQVLAQYHHEIAALEYCPHITLGLYREAYSAQDILQKMAQIKPQSFHFMANQLTFGYYQAQQLQGVLYPHTQIQLG